MQIIVGFSGILGCVLSLVYFYALHRFHGIVFAERPGLVDRKGPLSFFYEGMPRAFDPNVGMAVLRLAFSRTVRELKNPQAMHFAARIRWSFFLSSLFYLIMFAGIAAAGGATP